jgi:hypothetical protein
LAEYIVLSHSLNGNHRKVVFMKQVPVVFGYSLRGAIDKDLAGSLGYYLIMKQANLWIRYIELLARGSGVAFRATI